MFLCDESSATFPSFFWSLEKSKERRVEFKNKLELRDNF